jgi:hypothetical protein
MGVVIYLFTPRKLDNEPIPQHEVTERTRTRAERSMAPTSAPVLHGIEALQARVQRDEGKRGIGPLTRPGQLRAAAETLLASEGSGVLLLTGFPCLRERQPPCESDGPPGAVALAFTLMAIGRRSVTMPIEDHTAQVVQACVQACASPSSGGGAQPEVASFPTADRWTASDDQRLANLRAGASCILSIERAGDSSDGTCYTMRGYPMGASLVSKINTVATPGRGVPTVAIGDGGTELGMGSLYEDICRSVNLGETIGCVVAADAPLVASVSNWGGYALCFALALLAWDMELGDDTTTADDTLAEGYLSRVAAPDRETTRRVHLACSEAGAMDGITGNGDGAVDGMPLEAQLDVVDDLRAIALEAMAASPRGAACAN